MPPAPLEAVLVESVVVAVALPVGVGSLLVVTAGPLLALGGVAVFDCASEVSGGVVVAELGLVGALVVDEGSVPALTWGTDVEAALSVGSAATDSPSFAGVEVQASAATSTAPPSPTRLGHRNTREKRTARVMGM